MHSWHDTFGLGTHSRCSQSRTRGARRMAARLSGAQALEERAVMDATPLPVLLVIADRQDFYYQEYGDTRLGLESRGIAVQVAATTTAVSVPHAGTGEPEGTNGAVTPDIALADVNPDNYSAIAFVGGWGSSMYQYAFEGTYADGRYNGDLATKAVVNDLINEFLAQDKPVAAVCHATTILAWARVDGQSPLHGKTVSVPWIGSPAVTYQGQYYGYFELMQYPQAVANGAIANTVSGQYGEPGTVADDVVVDGRIITAENYDAAFEFGRTIGAEVLAWAAAAVPPFEPAPPSAPLANLPPALAGGTFVLAENSPAGTLVGTVTGSDPDAGQTLIYAIVGGNAGGAFSIDPATGAIRVAQPALLDFETTPVFHLTIEATDNGVLPLSTTAQVAVQLTDLLELTGVFTLHGGNLYVQGTSGADSIYVWTNHLGQSFAWVNGQHSGPHSLPGGRVVVFGGSGNDRIYATDSARGVTIYGEAGHDQITGGSGDDWIDGGDGYDRIWGLGGNDTLFGGNHNDLLEGGDGDDLFLGGEGDDQLHGQAGRDLMIGGNGYDKVDGGAGEDLLIGGRTSYDGDDAALDAIMSTWRGAGTFAERSAAVASGGYALLHGISIFGDGVADCLIGGADADRVFAALDDYVNYYAADNDDRITRQ